LAGYGQIDKPGGPSGGGAAGGRGKRDYEKPWLPPAKE